MRTLAVLPLALFTILTASSCCSYPKVFSNQSGTAVRAVIASPTVVEAYFGDWMKRINVAPAIGCPPSSQVVLAPAAQMASGPARFGAFGVRHGTGDSRITLVWWGSAGDLRRTTVKSTDGSKVQVRWLSERIARIEWSSGSKVIQINDDDSGVPFRELR